MKKYYILNTKTGSLVENSYSWALLALKTEDLEAEAKEQQTGYEYAIIGEDEAAAYKN